MFIAQSREENTTLFPVLMTEFWGVVFINELSETVELLSEL